MQSVGIHWYNDVTAGWITLGRHYLLCASQENGVFKTSGILNPLIWFLLLVHGLFKDKKLGMPLKIIRNLY